MHCLPFKQTCLNMNQREQGKTFVEQHHFHFEHAPLDALGLLEITLCDPVTNTTMNCPVPPNFHLALYSFPESSYQLTLECALGISELYQGTLQEARLRYLAYSQQVIQQMRIRRSP